jgi:hypothetical protein
LRLAPAAVFMLPNDLMAAVIPPNLPVGSQYQLLFVTAGTRDALSTAIADYNGFVGAQAALSPSLPTATWNAVASVSFGPSASLNAPQVSGLPVYNTHGEQLLADASDLYGVLGINQLDHPVGYDQFGNATPYNAAWTGSDEHGGHAELVANTGGPFPTPHDASLGTNDFFGFPNVAFIGSPQEFDGWLVGGLSSLGTWYDFTSAQHPLYALSAPITLMPEPSTLVLAVLALVCCGAHARRWRASERRAFAPSHDVVTPV